MDPSEPADREPDAEDELTAQERADLRERRPAALERFYALYFDRVYGYVRRLVHEEHLAEDVTQDIFMHILRALPGYDPARGLRPWVFTIALNKVRDHWRSRRHQEARRALPVEDVEGGDVRAGERGPQGALQVGELAEQVQRAVTDLPTSMRETFVLRYYEGLSFEAIGAILDRNATAVRKRYSRALEELRQALGPVLQHETDGRPPR